MSITSSAGFDMDTGHGPTGVAGFISWTRLEDLMHQTREVRERERVVHFHADSRGLTVYVEREP